MLGAARKASPIPTILYARPSCPLNGFLRLHAGVHLEKLNVTMQCRRCTGNPVLGLTKMVIVCRCLSETNISELIVTDDRED